MNGILKQLSPGGKGTPAGRGEWVGKKAGNEWGCGGPKAGMPGRISGEGAACCREIRAILECAVCGRVARARVDGD